MFATKLELYEEIVKRVHDGRLPAVDKLGDCAYRLDHTPECDIRCPAGLCLPDHEYDPGIERSVVYDIATHLRLPDDLTLEQLSNGQCIHDSWASCQVDLGYKIDTPEEFLAALKREWGIEDDK